MGQADTKPKIIRIDHVYVGIKYIRLFYNYGNRAVSVKYSDVGYDIAFGLQRGQYAVLQRIAGRPVISLDFPIEHIEGVVKCLRPDGYALIGKRLVKWEDAPVDAWVSIDIRLVDGEWAVV